MAKRLRKPKPGIYCDIPFSDYQAWPYVNNSSLGPAVRSGAHYHLAQQREPMVPSREMILGSMTHCLVLQPELFDSLYAVEPDFAPLLKWTYRNPAASDEFKGHRKKWLKEHADKVIVSADDRQAATRCADAVRGVMEHLYRQPGCLREVSLVSDCPETRLRLKSRLDVLLPDMIVDVKTTRDAGAFEQDIERFGYHRQGAFYQDVLAPRIGAILPVWLVAIETSAPYLVRSVQLDEQAIEEGRRDVMRALRRISRGLSQGVWDGYSPAARWRLPRHANVVDLFVSGRHVVIS